MANIKAVVSPRKNIVVTNFAVGSGGGGLDLSTGALITESTLPDQVLDQFSSTQYRVAKYFVQATYNNDVHAFDVTITHDGTDTFISTYGIILTNQELITVDADIDGVTNNVRFLVTPSFIGTTIKFTRIEVLV